MAGWRIHLGSKKDDPSTDPGPSARSAQSEQLERQLLHAVARGGRREFDSLYRIYHPRLQRFLGQLVHLPHLVDEVLDDTMMVVWQRADSFDGRSKLSTWIFGIAYRKGLKALSRLDLPQEDSETDERAEPGPTPEQQLGLVQIQARLRHALGQLSTDHRAVVELCYFHGMAYGEIAAVVDCPPETVKTRMFYARRKLRQLLSDVIDHMPGEFP